MASTPTQNFSATLDACRITIEDRVAFSENLLGAQVQTALAGLGFAGQTSARFFTNAIDTRTNGMDLVANYGVTLADQATLRMTWGTNWGRTFVTRASATACSIGAARCGLITGRLLLQATGAFFGVSYERFSADSPENRDDGLQRVGIQVVVVRPRHGSGHLR